MFMSTIKLGAMAEEAERNPRARKLFGEHGLGKNLPDIGEIEAGVESHRPYLSDLSWALFKSYAMLLGSAVIKVKFLERGEDPTPFFNFEGTKAILREALPDCADYIDAHGEAAHPKLAELLRERLLTELRRTLEGKEESEASVKQAGHILELAKEEQARRMEKRVDDVGTQE